MSSHSLSTLISMDPASLVPQFFPARSRQQLADVCRLRDEVLTPRDRSRWPALLADVEVLITGWGAPTVDASFLRAAPRLRHVVNATGSVKAVVSESLWDRGITVSSQTRANARPVAEFTLAAVVMSTKAAWWSAQRWRQLGHPPDVRAELSAAGTFAKSVGVIGYSTIGRLVVEGLQRLDVEVLVADPLADRAEVERAGARLVDLRTLLTSSHVVSLHAPSLPSTRSMLSHQELSWMRDGGTLINTARAELVDQGALLAELHSGRLNAVLDLITPGPEVQTLLQLSNVWLTPHLAGSVGTELHRLGHGVVEAVSRLAQGSPLRWPVDPSVLTTSA